MSKIKIDKGVPIPKSGLGRPAKWPWVEMKVGDSFFMPKPATSTGAYTIGKRLKRKFVQRAEGKGTRIWRVK